MTLTLYLTVVLTAFGSSLFFGFNLSAFNLPQKFIAAFLEDSERTRTFKFSIAVSCFIVGAAAGAFMSGIVADKVGRKVGLIINNAFGIVGATCIGTSKLLNAPTLVYIGRLIVGFNGGMSIGLVTMYFTEIAPQRLRGLFGCIHTLCTALGMLTSFILSFDSIFGTERLWFYADLSMAFPPLVQICLMWMVPESPRYLYLNKGKVKEARKAKAAFDPHTDIDMYCHELDEEKSKQLLNEKFKFSDILRKQYRKALTISLLLQVLQQLSGIHVVTNYSRIMLDSAGVHGKQVQYFVAGIGLVNLFSNLASLPLMDGWGRRSLLLWPTLVIICGLLAMTISINLARNSDYVQIASRCTVVFAYIYSAAFSIGLAPATNIVVAELFRQEARATAMSICMCFKYVCMFTVILSYPNLQNIIYGYVFLIFFVILVVLWVYFYFNLPETKNRSYDHIASSLEK